MSVASRLASLERRLGPRRTNVCERCDAWSAWCAVALVFEGEALGACDECGRSLDPTGKPIGYRDEPTLPAMILHLDTDREDRSSEAHEARG